MPGNQQNDYSLSSLIVAKKAIKNLRMATDTKKNLHGHSRPKQQRLSVGGVNIDSKKPSATHREDFTPAAPSKVEETADQSNAEG